MSILYSTRMHLWPLTMVLWISNLAAAEESKPSAATIIEIRDMGFSLMQNMGYVDKTVVAKLDNEYQIQALRIVQSSNTDEVWIKFNVAGNLMQRGFIPNNATRNHAKEIMLSPYYKIIASIKTESGVTLLKKLSGPFYESHDGRRFVFPAVQELSSSPTFVKLVSEIQPLQIRAIMLAIDDPSVKMPEAFFKDLNKVNDVHKYAEFSAKHGVYGIGCQDLWAAM